MDNNNQGQNMGNPTPTPTPTPNVVQNMQPHESSMGAVIATIIVLALIILGGLYFWGQRSNSMDQTYPSGQAQNDNMYTIESQSSSDETSSIKADLEATDVDNLDAELNAS